MGGSQERKVTVLVRDRKAAVRRWKRKGWVVARVTAGPPVDSEPRQTVTLHVQKPARKK